jgi:RNA polymerase sigma factor (sigma-70 family)
LVVLSDPLLLEYLENGDPARSGKLLEALVFQQAEPVARSVVWRRLGSSAPAQDRDDVVGDVIAELIARLTTLQRGESDSIGNLRGYAAVTAHHGCDQYLRLRFPRRHRLKARMRYLMESARDYELWDSESGEPACGPAKWRTRKLRTDLPPGWHHSVSLGASPDERAIVAAVFQYSGSPLLFDDLVDGVAALSGLGDETPAPWEDAEQHIAAPPSDTLERLDYRQRLEQLWVEIRDLPAAQKAALLLNLRDNSGMAALPAFPALGVASMRQIAAALEMPAEELAGLWGRMPLSDLEIAARLGLQRQQVINLRKAARQRLARRTAGNIVSISTSKREKVS